LKGRMESRVVRRMARLPNMERGKFLAAKPRSGGKPASTRLNF